MPAFMEIVHFETLGCKLNQIETESLAHAFAEAGFGIDLDGNEALPVERVDIDTVYRPVGMLQPSAQPGLCVVNTCTVTGKAEQKARRLIRLLLRRYPNAPILVTGCYAEVEGAAIAAIDSRISVFPGTRKGELATLPSWLADRRLIHPDENLASMLAFFCARRKPTGDLPQRTNTFSLSTDTFHFHSRASIKIQDGCDNHCSYCRIRLARGRSESLAASEVLDRIRKIEEAGWAEVVLTGVNLSLYRSDGGDFATLLSRILRETRGIAIRISSLYPERVDDEILPMLAHERIRPHFHLSVQSGSDRILSSMRRPYTAETVYRAVERLRSVKENPFLACDIIVGFPGETEEDFAATLELCARVGFAWIHAFPFSPRPGTEAYRMRPRIPERIAGERVAILSALARESHANYEKYWVDRELPAIVEKSPRAAGISALTSNHLSVRLPPADISAGTSILVRIAGNGKAQIVK